MLNEDDCDGKTLLQSILSPEQVEVCSRIAAIKGRLSADDKKLLAATKMVVSNIEASRLILSVLEARTSATKPSPRRPLWLGILTLLNALVFFGLIFVQNEQASSLSHWLEFLDAHNVSRIIPSDEQPAGNQAKAIQEFVSAWNSGKGPGDPSRVNTDDEQFWNQFAEATIKARASLDRPEFPLPSNLESLQAYLDNLHAVDVTILQTKVKPLSTETQEEIHRQRVATLFRRNELGAKLLRQALISNNYWGVATDTIWHKELDVPAWRISLTELLLVTFLALLWFHIRLYSGNQSVERYPELAVSLLAVSIITTVFMRFVETPLTQATKREPILLYAIALWLGWSYAKSSGLLDSAFDRVTSLVSERK